MRDLSGILAQHVVGVRFADLPAATVAATKRCLLDALGVSLAATSLGEGCGAFIAMAQEEGGRSQAAILGTATRVSAAQAAFANGSLAHALDFEDAHDAALVHPNAPTVPAALAVAEAQGGIDGKALIAALAVGCDLVCRLGLALRESPDKFGWYPPPILAAFGATAAAGRLMGLSVGQMRDAFSLTLCQATCSAELKYSPHSTIRAVRDAFAARTGVVSADLARRGVKGFDHPFEGKAGFYALYARGAYDPDTLVNDLGRAFEGENISLKPWPSCRGTHAFIEAALDLARTNAIRPEAVQSVRLTGHPINTMLAEPVAQKQAPATAIDAKFSLPFTVATALCRGSVTLDDFRPAALSDAGVLALAQRVAFAAGDVPHVTSGQVEIRTAGGAVHAGRVEFPLGNPRNPLDEAALVAKFRACARLAVRAPDAARIERIIDQTLQLERLTDVRDFAALG